MKQQTKRNEIVTAIKQARSHNELDQIHRDNVLLIDKDVEVYIHKRRYDLERWPIREHKEK